MDERQPGITVLYQVLRMARDTWFVPSSLSNK